MRHQQQLQDSASSAQQLQVGVSGALQLLALC
jgi:hypothetical protein